DGYFILALSEERFPRFEPEVEEGGVRVVPWVTPDPLGDGSEASRCFRFEPRGGPAVATFQTLRAFSALRFRAGVENAAAPHEPLVLTILDDEGRVLHASSIDRPEPVTVSCGGADRVRVEVALSGGDSGPAPVAWLTAVSFEWGTTPADELAFQAYGEGCIARAAGGSALPELDASGEATPGGTLRFVCTNAPPGATGTLAIGSAPVSKELPGGCRALVERTSSTITLQISADEHGRAELEVEMPADVRPGSSYAQVVFRDPADARSFLATTNGLRVLVRAR